MENTRRQFLATASTALAALAIVPRHVRRGPEFVPPSEKVNIAMVTLLGVLSLRLAGKQMDWGPQHAKVNGLPEADPLIHGSYRKGCELA